MLKQVSLGCLVWVCSAWMGWVGAQPAPAPSSAPASSLASVPTFSASAVTGAGASFPAQVYVAWAAAFTKDRKIAVNYVPTDSSEGVSQIRAHAVDFGATDTPLSPAEVRKFKLIQFPSMVGGVVVVVNLKGVFTGGLRLTGEVLVDIFSGDIKLWSDPRIASLNPGVALPFTPVVRLIREEPSGTTESFTRYLATQNSSWQKNFGVGQTVKWRGENVVFKRQDELLEVFKKTTGAISYMSFDRARGLGLPIAALRNASGRFVAPSEAAFAAAVRASGLHQSTTFTDPLINLPGPEVWPITQLTYILLDAEPKLSLKAVNTAKFFYWAFMKGDSLIKEAGFVPLPPAVQALSARRLNDIKPVDGTVINLFGDAAL